MNATDTIKIGWTAFSNQKLEKALARKGAAAAERFFQAVNISGPRPHICPSLGPCWIWTSTKNANGYGMFSLTNRSFLAHRVAYTLLHGTIGQGLTLDHLCRVRECVNPIHLEPVPMLVNLLRGESPFAKKARMDRCVNGHPFTKANTRIRKNGTRQCRKCDAIRQKTYQANKSKQIGMKVQTLYSRLRRGWPKELALVRPTQQGKRYEG